MERQTQFRRLGHALLILVVIALSFDVVSGFDDSEAAAAPGRVALPGTFELEDYASFYDTTRGNSGRAYRNDDVDIQRCYDFAARGACYNIGWITPGEWLGFDVTVASSGSFTFTARVASYFSGQTFHVEVDGVNVTGPIEVPNTRSLLRWETVTSQSVTMLAGDHDLRLVADGSNFNMDNVTVTQVTVDAAPAETPVAPAPTPEPTPVAPTPEPAPTETTPQIPADVSLPGTFEVENYTSYSDATTGNRGRRYRSDDVDIEDCIDPATSGNCYNVAYVDAGEWLGYNMSVARDGAFTFTTRVASPYVGRTFHLEVDGVDLTGPIEVPNTGGYQGWMSVTSTPVALTAGAHSLRIVAGDSGFNLNTVTVDEVAAPAQPEPAPQPDPQPVTPAAVSLPGTFEVENYTSYSDTTPGNSGEKYRNDDVDIEDCTDSAASGGCYNVGYVKSGEWLGFDLSVTTTGSFTFSTRVASPNDGRAFRFQVDGVDVTGQIAVPNTGAYQAWTTVTSNPVSLTAGKHTLQVVADTSGFNLNSVTVAEAVPAAPVPAPAPQPGLTGPAYYVSPTGNDRADGSEANPWRSLTASMKKLRAGDTLLVRGGTYRERVEVRGESVPRGTPDARITVRAYPGEEPLVVGIFWVSNADYWTFDNIDVTWDPANTNSNEHMVRMYRGQGWIYQNSEIYGARSYAALLVNGNSTGWLITNNYIHDTYQSNALSQDHLIYISDGSNGIVERNLLVNALNGRGVKLGNPQTGEVLPANVVVRYNTIVNTGSGNVGVSYDAHDNQIYGNVLINPGEIYYTVHAWYLTGPNNVVRDNLTYGSKKGVTKADGGLVDGGNLVADPMLDDQYKPTNPAAYDANGVVLYGHLAGTTR